jgi:hypothetical protein
VQGLLENTSTLGGQRKVKTHRYTKMGINLPIFLVKLERDLSVF